MAVTAWPAVTICIQGREDGAVTFAFEGIPWRCIQEHTRLLVTERWGEAFVGVDLGPLHALYGSMYRGIALATVAWGKKYV